MWVFRQEQAAFQSGVYGHDFRFLAEQTSVGFLGDLQDLGVRIRRPAGISVALGYLGSGQ